MNELGFPIESGIGVQKERMRHWKRMLKTSVYQALVAEVKRQNARPMKTGYDVFRGSEMDTWVHNYITGQENDARRVDLPLKSFDVPVCRVGYGFATITVMAHNDEEAEQLALDEAGNHEFSEKNSEYQIV